MSLIHGLLGILNYSDMTGYELAKTFNESLYFFWQAQISQIYREVNKMESQGFLCSRIEIQTEKPNKRIYSITEAGKAELQDWLNSKMPDEMMASRSEVLLRLFFSSEKTTDENIESLEHIADVYERRILDLNDTINAINEYKKFAHSEKDMLYWDLTADFGRAYNRMCVEWAKSCIKRLEETR